MCSGVGVIVMPSPEGVGDALGISVRQAVGDDQDTFVLTAGAKRLDRQEDEVIPVAGDEDSPLLGGKGQLFPIRVTPASDLVDARDIESEATGDLRHGGVQILIQEEAHCRQGGQERRDLGVANGSSRRTRSGVHSSSRCSRSSISWG